MYGRDEIMEVLLRKSWLRERVSVRGRSATWDAVVLTASSPEQSDLYTWQLDRAKRLGRIPRSTLTLSVPDPNGLRIGSGAASLHALNSLYTHYSYMVGNISDSSSESSAFQQKPKDDVTLFQLTQMISKKHILLLHAGGDSKRVPWANPMGKIFLPLPYLADNDPDGPVPLLFDHILAISSCARQAFKNEGGLFIMSGDVLPCFDASVIVLPDDTPCIITVPITLDIASNHGVIVASKIGNVDNTCSMSLVENLLQKPSIDELVKSQAILDDGRILLDTGIIAVRGKAWLDILELSCSCQPMIVELMSRNQEMSLYEDIVSAWVPAKHEWLKKRPFGETLIKKLGTQRMFTYRAYDLLFLHFGTSSEVLDHLISQTGAGLVGRRHMCSIPSTTESHIAPSAIILSSKITHGVSIGEDSMIYDSSVSCGVHIGSQSIVVGVHIPEDHNRTEYESLRFELPDRHCLWEVPLVRWADRIIVYCGIQDNPKQSISSGGTFCGKPLNKVLHDLHIPENDLWDPEITHEKCLWNAKIFPIHIYFTMLNLAMWLMGLRDLESELFLPLWRSSRRVSLEELHGSINFSKMCIISRDHQAHLAAEIAKACIDYGSLGHNLAQLCEEIIQNKIHGFNVCKGLLDACPKFQARNSRILPKSRAYQVQVDLLRACGNEKEANQLEHKVWDSVAAETASRVRYEFNEHVLDPSDGTALSMADNVNNIIVDQTLGHKIVKVELPVRVDFVGGWSDTPPWSLERTGCVLNMAISLGNTLPIGTCIETTMTSGVFITDDAKNHLFIDDLRSIKTPFDSDDPFRLVKSALLVTGIIHRHEFKFMGLRISTWAHVPLGSGMGTSSILAAAVVKGLLQVVDGNVSNENIARLVLVLEQIMGTGGGWQDQIGGLYPGIKFTTSFPGIPLQLQVISLLASKQLIMELQQRLLVVFTGQVRLAHRVLQMVVLRYLRRDNLLISSIKRLVELAKIGREAILNCDVDGIGKIMLEAWQLHQELDPYCSNEFVDRLFAFADGYSCGYKLVGAGGGGFALLLAKDAENARELRRVLEGSSDFDVKFYNWEVAL